MTAPFTAEQIAIIEKMIAAAVARERATVRASFSGPVNRTDAIGKRIEILFGSLPYDPRPRA